MRNIYFTLLTAFLAVNSAFGGKFSEQRLNEVAAMLPQEPRADGARASDRAKWDPLAATRWGRSRIASAEKLLGQPVPDTPDELYFEFLKNGNRRNYESCYFRRYSRFENLYVAECLEHKGRFINKIVEYVDAFCAMKSWTLPAHDSDLTCFKGTPHVELFSSELTLGLAFCNDWLCDELPAATRAKIIAEIERRTLKPHLDHARGTRKLRHWWLHGGNNWNSVCNCNVLRTALATVKDRRLRAEFVLIAEESVPYALRGYNSDGYCSEGMGYWNYGYGHHLMMGLSVRAATGGKINFFSDPKNKDVMKYAYGYQLVNGISPYFADGGGSPSPVMLALGRQVWPDLVSTAALKCPTFIGSSREFSLRAFGQEPAPVAPTMDVLPPRSWFPEAQVLISRFEDKAPGRNFCVAIKGGHNAELHNHNDVGTYTILVDGQEIVGDPGGEVYTRRTFSKDRYKSKVLNSYGHPVPLIGGKLQRGGRAAAAKVIATNFTADEDSITLDCTAAYDVPSLKSLVRTMVFNRSRNTVAITDKVSFKEPTAFEVPVITYRDWVPEDGAMRFEFKHPRGKRVLSLDVTASAPLEFSSEKIENPGKPSPCRMKFAFEKPVTDAEITLVFAPETSGDAVAGARAGLAAVKIPDGWRFTRSGGEVLLEQHAATDSRPYIHPLMSPTGRGTFTENSPGHHWWQHGLYTGLHAVNGINFWEREKNQFHPRPVAKPSVNGSKASWKVENLWTDPSGKSAVLDETQEWTLVDSGSHYTLDVIWILEAKQDVNFGKWSYGGLFLRMPFRSKTAAISDAVNSRGQRKNAAEQQEAEWVAVTTPPLEGGTNLCTVAMIEHPSNPGYPNKWRVDGQLGVAPSYCIRGPWKLSKGNRRVNRYRIVVKDGTADASLINGEMSSFADKATDK